MQLVDTHCHLDMLPSWLEGEISSAQATEDIDAAVQRARDAGVRWMLNPGVTWESVAGVIAVAERHPDVVAAVGIHPHDAASWGPDGSERLRAFARHPKVVAIGEAGLDYYYAHSSKDEQRRAFRDQLAIARELERPIIVHTRDAEADTLALLREVAPPKGVLHCFTGTAALAAAAVELGYYVSMSGVVTFKKSDDLRAVALQIPLERLLIETDAPYLAPPPHRGKRNEPAYVVRVAEQLAELHGMDVAELGRVTTENAGRLFGVSR